MKGKSGNPNRRPKKPGKASHESIKLPLDQLVLAEANRVLTLREDGRPAKRTVSETIVMKTWMTAAAGNAHAQRTFLQLIQNAQAREDSQRRELLLRAYELKLDLEEARDQYVAGGGDEFSMRVHPTDIEIDYAKGDVRFFIPLTDEEWAARAYLVRVLNDEHVILERHSETVMIDGDDALLQLGREGAIFRVHVANEALPPRLRRPPPAQFRIRASTAARLLDRLSDWPQFRERIRAKLSHLDPG